MEARKLEKKRLATAISLLINEGIELFFFLSLFRSPRRIYSVSIRSAPRALSSIDQEQDHGSDIGTELRQLFMMRRLIEFKLEAGFFVHSNGSDIVMPGVQIDEFVLVPTSPVDDRFQQSLADTQALR